MRTLKQLTLALALALTVAVSVTGITLFGQNLRALFASNANCLGSADRYALAPYKVKTHMKRISNFGNYEGGSSYASSFAAPEAEPMTRVEPEQFLRPNGWTQAKDDALSTFAADVDTASYTLARRALREGSLPPKENVRVEEFVNFFRYDYPAPDSGPFAVHTDLAPSPFAQGSHLMRIGVQAKRVSLRDRKRVHLTFLVDVSGSMASQDKLPLAKESLKLLVKNLREDDTVALVTYAGDTREVLPSTPAARQSEIFEAIDSLDAGGGTAMGSGMELAYRNAVRELKPGEVSRVIVLSDGDANIGRASHEEILESIKSHVQEGVTLSTIGFGMGNYRDQLMEQLADKGNGNAFYVDSMTQARRLFQEQLGGMLEVVAKDVKLQVEFDRDAVKRYRLMGYENRDVKDEDFRNDRADGGEIGAGHTVTALYEVELTGRGQTVATVRVRAKAPNGETATESAFPVTASSVHPSFEKAPSSFRLAAVAGGFADRLRGGSETRFEQLASLARDLDASDDVRELQELIERAGRYEGSLSRR